MIASADHAPTYVVRPAGPADLEGFKELRELAGPGFTSLMVSDAALAQKLDFSAASFAAEVSEPGPERYLLGLEHVPTGRLVGCCQVKSTVGASPPFYNFRILQIAQSSAVVARRFDLGVLILVNDFTGASEVGSLFVRAEHRAAGIGRMLAQSRYLLIASAPQRFNDRVVSELRGVVTPDGRSPFWDALGAHFFRMEFSEADRLSATTDNQFILDLMPKFPIYVDLLPEAARAVIGQCHPDGVGARRLLEWEGFRTDNVVDIFDGGPLVSVARDSIRTLRTARRYRIEACDTNAPARQRALIARPSVRGFRCASAHISIAGAVARLDGAARAALGVEVGEDALIWADDAS